MIPLDEAMQLVLEQAQGLQTENVDLNHALGRVLAQDVIADSDQPPFSKSLVDGFAVGFDCQQASGTKQLTVTGNIAAGEASSNEVGEDVAFQIMTGAPVPRGTTAVVMIEDTKTVTEASIELQSDPIKPRQCILEQGAVCRTGETVATAGSILSPARIGVLAEAGCARPQVACNPSIAIVTTGDEIVPVDEKPSDRHIRNSNGPLLVAAANQLTDECRYVGHIGDEKQSLRDAIQEGLKSELLVITGGVSMGQKDLIPHVLEELDVKKVFHRVNLKPGKPVWFGVAESKQGQRTLVFGLPGNPVSTFVCFHLFVRAAFQKLRGEHVTGLETATAYLNSGFVNRGNRFLLQPGVYCGKSHQVDVLQWVGSADQIRLSAANCLIEFPASSEFSVNDPVVVRRLL